MGNGEDRDFNEALSRFVAGPVADKLRDALTKKIKESEVGSRSFHSPAWSEQTAYNFGRIDLAREMLNLLTRGER